MEMMNVSQDTQNDIRGNAFLKGAISDENIEAASRIQSRLPGCMPITLLCGPGTACGNNLQILPTAPGHVCSPQVSADCCWIFLATTNCSVTAPNGATCCWRILATTDCTTTVGGQACCWHILSTTDCTSTGGSCDCR